MTFTPGYETRPFDKVLSALGDRVVIASDTKATAGCPAHDDRNPSFSLKSGQNGKVIPLEEKGGMYVLNMWVAKDQAHPF